MAKVSKPQERTDSTKQDVYPYGIESVRVLPNYCLEISFENGEKRVADIWKMRGNNALFKQAFENFAAVEHYRYWVQWPAIFNGKPNSIEIEDQDLWNAGQLVEERRESQQP